MESKQGDGKANKPDSTGGSKSLPGDQEANEDLAISASGEHICNDATDPAQADIQRLCHIWAEVGRAILLRRQGGHETFQK